jgi:hypothetical protein
MTRDLRQLVTQVRGSANAIADSASESHQAGVTGQTSPARASPSRCHRADITPSRHHPEQTSPSACRRAGIAGQQPRARLRKSPLNSRASPRRRSPCSECEACP